MNKLVLFLKGLLMGAADVVPGVSGGTIAFITGIYAELVETIRGFNLSALKVLKNDGLKAVWQYLNGNFLVVLLLGILTSVLSLANLMQFLLVEHPLPLWSFFSGLIVGSVIFLLRQIPLMKMSHKLLFIVGALIAYGISVAPSTVLEGNPTTMFFAGSIALCAMILPGISGSFILVLIGLYPVFIDAIAEFNITLLSSFAVGGLLGLMLFSRLLSWLLAHYLTAVMALMCGFLVGSLNIIWPWKQAVSSVTTDSGKIVVTQTENLLPDQFLLITQQDPQVILCISFSLMGYVLAFGLEYIGKAKSRT